MSEYRKHFECSIHDIPFGIEKARTECNGSIFNGEYRLHQHTRSGADILCIPQRNMIWDKQFCTENLSYRVSRNQNRWCYCCGYVGHARTNCAYKHIVCQSCKRNHTWEMCPRNPDGFNHEWILSDAIDASEKGVSSKVQEDILSDRIRHCGYTHDYGRSRGSSSSSSSQQWNRGHW